MPPDEVRDRHRSSATHRGLALAVAVLAVLVVAASVVAAVEVRGQISGASRNTVRFSAADLSTADPSFRLGPDQVPSVAGLNAEQASALLKSVGYGVRVATRGGCASAAGELRLEPPTGTIVDPGSTVTLHEVVPSPGGDCAQGDHPDSSVLAFLAWARGLGPIPRFADDVRVRFVAQHASGGGSRILHRAEVGDRSAWPGLGSLADALAVPLRSPTTLIPLAVTRMDATCSPPPGGTCPDWRGAELGGDPGLANRKDETEPLFDVTLQFGAQRRITAVVLDDERTGHSSVEPDVAGDSQAYATARLRAFGFNVATSLRTFCTQPGLVIGAKPSGINTVILDVSRGGGACSS